MNTATIYREDSNDSAIWSSIVRDLELPKGTDEIIVRTVTHVTEKQRRGTRAKGGRKSPANKGSADRGSTVQIVIAGGAVQSVVKPRGVALEIRDYDVDGADVEKNENCEQDEDGDWYQRMFWDEDEIEG